MNDRETQMLFDGWRDDFIARLPARFRTATLDSYETPKPAQKAAKKAVVAWCDNVTLEGPGLFLTGTVGTGKTHLAVVAACRLIGERGLRGRYLSCGEFLEKRRESFGGGTKSVPPREVVRHCQFMVIDDIGVERMTEWVADQLCALIDAAYNAGVLVIVTSNLSYSELAKPNFLGDRAVSRLIEMTDKVEFSGDDWRRGRHTGRKA